uniref:Decapping nuclease n=1 Tax=Meloidogyne hapla TaxID=6305 RepID=A0A1I8BS39_MELHA
MNCSKLPNISSDPLNFLNVDQKTNLLLEPVRVAEFSLDNNRRPVLGRSKARYFYEPALGKGRKIPIKAKLSDGYNKDIIKEREDDGLIFLTRWISSMAPPNSILKEKIHDCDFVICRGTLLRLMTSCYDSIPHSVGMKLVCCKFKGVYFIREYYTPTRIEKEANMSDRHSRMCYEAHKFKVLVTTKGEGRKPDFREAVCVKPDFMGVFKATIISPSHDPSASFRLFYGAEIDCIMPSTGLYLGLKTQFKMLGFGQGFSDKGRLNQVELLDLSVLVNHLTMSGAKVACCFVFLYQFLQAVKNYLDMAPEGTILLSERLPTSTEFNFKLFEEGSAEAAVYEVINNEFKSHGWL